MALNHSTHIQGSSAWLSLWLRLAMAWSQSSTTHSSKSIPFCIWTPLSVLQWWPHVPWGQGTTCHRGRRPQSAVLRHRQAQ